VIASDVSCSRDIKTTLGLDVLRCQTPAMVCKEIVMHALASNLIRALMQDIAHSHHRSCPLNISGIKAKKTIGQSPSACGWLAAHAAAYLEL
jgi:Cys-tRNA synthase (O-phospho-L-seryl-tRNA:Cys-tRNA synthase)